MSVDDEVEGLIHAAKRHAAAGKLDAAEAAYRYALELDPNRYQVWNNLGTILEVRERAREALEAYRRAEHFAPDEPLILHNIALLLYRMERHADAISAWYRLIEVDPSLAEPHFALGNIHMDRGHFVDAAICFVKAADLDPDMFQAYSNLGAALLEVGQISGAESAFERAVSLHPSAVDYFNLAKTQELLGRPQSAMASYRASLEIEPDSAVAHERLAQLYAREHSDALIPFVKDWLARMPDNPEAQHMALAVSGEKPERASAEYVASLFDRFAGEFDAALRRLDYQAPRLVGEVLEATGLPADGVLLDLGCGTGLSGEAVKHLSAKLIGVDLSSQMLELARKKGIYDELHVADLTEFLEGSSETFDIVIACDTLNYLGDLAGVLRAAYARLSDAGRLVFTLESDETVSSYTLRSTGRFVHNRDYVEGLLRELGFSVEATPMNLRNESGIPVSGLMIAARKPSQLMP